MILRDATTWDVDELAALHAAAFGLPLEQARVEMKDELTRPWSKVIVAEEHTSATPARHMLGYAVFWFVADEGNVLHVAVGEASRRRGIGAKLMTRGLEIAKERGANTCVLEVRTSNIAAIALYVHFGFTQVTIRKRYYPDNEDALVMSLAIPA